MMKKINIHINKKVAVIIICYILLIGIISGIYLMMNNSTNKIDLNNPGGTGGGYVPPNTVTITNSGVLYRGIGRANTEVLQTLLKKAVLYNISISNDIGASSVYVQDTKFQTKTAKHYKNRMSYTVTIDSDEMSSPDGVPWNYMFTFTVSDGRHYRVDLNCDPNIEMSLFSIKKNG